MTMKAAVAALVAHMAVACLAQEWKHEVRGFPYEAVEGQTLTFAVAYSAPEPVKLHAEAKDPSNVVHVGATQTVSGKGVARFSIQVPEGKFGGQMLVAIWMGDDWQQPRRAIIHVGPIPVYTAAQGRQMAAAARRGAAIRQRLGLDARKPALAVVSGGWAGRSAALAQAYRKALSDVGQRCVTLGPDALSAPEVLDPKVVRLLLIPEAQVYPGEALATLERYLRQGGHLVVLGAPAFDRVVRRLPGAAADDWVDEQQMAERLRRTPARRKLLDMAQTSANAWRRSANDMASAASWRVEPAGSSAAALGPEAAGMQVLRHEIGNLTGWETLEADLSRPGGDGDNLILFSARGGDSTAAVAVELRERDGSRWMAAVPLSARWQRYAVPASAFRLWDPDKTSGRGAPGDQLNLRNAATAAVGLAFTHTSVPGGRHLYWFADLGSAAGPDQPSYAVPTLDTISPVYKLYPIRGAQRLEPALGRPLVAAPTPAMPRNLLSTHPRPTGAGFGKEKKYRWTPLLQVQGKQGVAGSVATLVQHLKGPYAGGRWASFTVADREWYARPDVVRYISAVAARMLQPEMLAEAGAQFFGYFPDEKPLLGARVAGVRPSGLTASFSVSEISAGKEGRIVYRHSAPLKLSGSDALAQVRWNPTRLSADRYLVRVKLLRNGKVADELSHEITIRGPLGAKGSPRPTSWVTVRDGQFSVAGKPWFPHGVNYMPSSGVAAEDMHYFEQWLSAESYDPLVIDRDLSRVAAAGFDHISAFIYTESTHNRNLVDLLNRCDAHGLRVNLSLRPGTPLDFAWPAIGEIIKANRLADDPTVFAYDLAWEPAWGYRDQRRRWDGEWAEWIRQRYGSIENAERDWGEKAPREDGRIAGPSDADVTSGSAIPHVVAAYRRFQDDFLSRKHMEARRKIRTVDTRHLLSFRMSIAGDPTCGPTIMPYDFSGLARSMDFMSPEGYGRIGDEERVKPGWFTAAYSRLVAPGRPALWAEFGYTLWNKGLSPAPEDGLSFADAFDRRHYLPGTIEFTERYYRAFYEMAPASGAAGTVCWWYPGGFRFGENSDYGIINPDGTWRGLTRIIAGYARRFADRPMPPPIDAWITVDRDRHPDGIYGIYSETKEEFWRLADAGKFPGLRTEADGADSAGCPLIAVGNLPATASNPPKYLNGEFEHVRVLGASGAWVAVPYEGGSVEVKAGAPVRLRVLAGNNGPAKWLARSGSGAVRVVVLSPTGELGAARLSADVGSLGTASEVEITLPATSAASMECVVTLEATGRCRFGEKRTVRLTAR